jgi:DNA-3-methyladenine glycosylase II
MFAEKLKLNPVPPFDFDLSMQIFRSGDRQIRIYESGKFHQVIRLSGKLALVKLQSTGTVELPLLQAELTANKEITHEEEQEAVKVITRLLNLDLDLAVFCALVKRDKTLDGIARQLRGLRSPTTQTVYEALIDSVVEQQISLRVANVIERRIIKKFGEALMVGEGVYYAYPTPEALADAAVDDLRRCGLSQRKAEYIRQISALVAERKLNLEEFRSYESTERIVGELDAVRGIGRWTAELTVIRALQRWDAMPADDVGLRRIISQFYCGGKRITSDEAKKIAEPWGKWRGLAAYYFVVAELMNLKD